LRDVVSFYTFLLLLLFKQNAPNCVAKKKAETRVIVLAEASDRVTFMAPVTASQRWPFFAINDPEANTALPPPAHPRRR
jgi:hypothetical protein